MKTNIYKCFITTNKGKLKLELQASGFLNALAKLYEKANDLRLEIYSIDGITKIIKENDYKIKE